MVHRDALHHFVLSCQFVRGCTIQIDGVGRLALFDGFLSCEFLAAIAIRASLGQLAIRASLGRLAFSTVSCVVNF